MRTLRLRVTLSLSRGSVNSAIASVFTKAYGTWQIVSQKIKKTNSFFRICTKNNRSMAQKYRIPQIQIRKNWQAQATHSHYLATVSAALAIHLFFISLGAPVNNIYRNPRWEYRPCSGSDTTVQDDPSRKILYSVDRARNCKRLISPGINSEESIPSAYVAWRAGTKHRVVVPARQAWNRFLGSINGLQIRAQLRSYFRIGHGGWELLE